MPTFSLATNASIADAVRLRHVVPSWLRVFGDQLAEVVVVVDSRPPMGRIAQLHGNRGSLEELEEELHRLHELDARVRHVLLPPPEELETVARRWFTHGVPVRCQAGTPILTFFYAKDVASEDLVVRADCDMLFFDRGWLEEGHRLLAEDRADLIEIPRPGVHEATSSLPVSLRATLLLRSKLRERCFPIRPHRLDLARRIHRRLNGRPPWVHYEEMFQIEREAGRLRYLLLSDTLGFGIHVVSRADAELPGFEDVVTRVERGDLPEGQRNEINFVPSAWGIDQAAEPV